MQNKNTILFIVLAMIIIVGWSWLQPKIWPPAKRPEHESPLPITHLQWSQLGTSTAALALSPGVPGLGDAAALAAALGNAQYGGKQADIQLAARRPEPKPKPAPKEAPVVAAVPANPHKEIVLGDATWNLKVTLTSLGAGARDLTLNYFQQADRDGRPVWRDPKTKKDPEPLVLFDNSGENDYPSYLLLHYANKEENDVRPIDKLRTVEWKVEAEEKNADDGSGKVVFSTDALPDVIIYKTYTLQRGDYHLGLDVKIRRKESSKGKTIKFRYQFASPHGLRVEGIWYTTSSLRNALIGLENAKGDLTRSLEEAHHIGVREGGDDVSKKEDKAIRWAGVTVQHFASMVVVVPVVGNHLPKILARATPTLESDSIKGKVGKVNPEKNEFALDKLPYTFVVGKGVGLPDEGKEVRVVWR